MKNSRSDRTAVKSPAAAWAFAMILCLPLFLSSAAAKGGVVVRGDGVDQLSAADVAHVQNLAAQLMPGHRLAVIDANLSRGVNHRGTLSLLHVYSEPVEQTARVWRGFHFKCVLTADYHPPVLPPTASERNRIANETVQTNGRWLVARATPVDHYAVICGAGTTLPLFSSDQLGLFAPARIGRRTLSEKAVAIYDFVVDGAVANARLGREDLADIATLPICFIQVSENKAEVELGTKTGRRVRVRLKRDGAGWLITEFKR